MGCLRPQQRPQADPQRVRVRQGRGPTMNQRAAATIRHGLDGRPPGDSGTDLRQRTGQSVTQRSGWTIRGGPLQRCMCAEPRLDAQGHHVKHERQAAFDPTAPCHALRPQPCERQQRRRESDGPARHRPGRSARRERHRRPWRLHPLRLHPYVSHHARHRLPQQVSHPQQPDTADQCGDAQGQDMPLPDLRRQSRPHQRPAQPSAPAPRAEPVQRRRDTREPGPGQTPPPRHGAGNGSEVGIRAGAAPHGRTQDTPCPPARSQPRRDHSKIQPHGASRFKYRSGRCAGSAAPPRSRVRPARPAPSTRQACARAAS